MNKRQAPDGSFPGDGKKSGSPYSQLTTFLDKDTEFSWGDVDGELIRLTLEVVTRRGDAISFAVNRNRTAGSVTILSGADRPRWYAETVTEANALLTQIIQLGA